MKRAAPPETAEPKEPRRRLFYGDNLAVMRKYIDSDTVDMCYIDPPFNSSRDYNQIYNRVGDAEDRAQARAFIDTWTWDDMASQAWEEITRNAPIRLGAPPPYGERAVALIEGLGDVLGKGSMLAYLVFMAQRIAEIHRVLKPSGSLYLHCDPTASHYLKLVLDAVFCGESGDYINEIVWCYSTGGRSNRHYPKKHDVIFLYAKDREKNVFYDRAVRTPRDTSTMHEPVLEDEQGRPYQRNIKHGKEYRYYLDEGVLPNDYWTDIQAINPAAKERLGYPTQKPEALLERIIRGSTVEGDLVLDAFCGCGTTVAVAEREGRRWIGIDVTYNAIAAILKRLEDAFTANVARAVETTGIPQDMESAVSLKNSPNDRLRKDFEKWAILTYTDGYAVPNEKKGADRGIEGIDGRIRFRTDDGDGKVVFQVKSGAVHRSDVSTLHSDMQSDGADMAVLITLEEPTSEMRREAKAKGAYDFRLMGRKYDTVRIVTIREMVEQGVRLELPLPLDARKRAKKHLGGGGAQAPLIETEAEE